MTSGAHQIQVRGSPGAIECGFVKTFQPFAVSCAHSPPNSFSDLPQRHSAAVRPFAKSNTTFRLDIQACGYIIQKEFFRREAGRARPSLSRTA